LAWEKVRKAFSYYQYISGKVNNLQKYGVFIDLGGIDGLLHVSEISGERIDNIAGYFNMDTVFFPHSEYQAHSYIPTTSL
jgi:polyribonucleotide nucleotidyltransferase